MRKEKTVLAKWIKSWRGIQKEISEEEYFKIVRLINEFLGRSYEDPRWITLDTGEEELILRIIPLKKGKYLLKVE